MQFTSSSDEYSHHRNDDKLNQTNSTTTQTSQTPSSSHSVSNLINTNNSQQRQAYLDPAFYEVMSTLNASNFNSVINQISETQNKIPFYDFKKYLQQFQ